jgi:cytochrome P450
VRKSDSYKVWRRTIDALNTWSTISNDLHAQKRRVLNYAFSEAAMRSAEPFVHANVDRWIELLSQQKKEGNEWSDSIDMSDHVTYLVFDILGDLCFGKCFDMKEPGSDLRYVPKTLTGFLKIIHPVSDGTCSQIWPHL